MSLGQLETWVACCCEPCDSGVPRQQRPFHHIGQAAGKLLSQPNIVNQGANDSPLFFLPAHLTALFIWPRWVSLHPNDHLSPRWLSSSVLIHLSTSKGTNISLELLWHVRYNRPDTNGPRCCTFASDVLVYLPTFLDPLKTLLCH